MLDRSRPRYRFRIVVPAYPAFNVYSNVAKMTTSLGPVYIASNVNRIAHWDAEVIDENNLRLHGPKAKAGGANHDLIQKQRPADVVGLYGGLTSTIPRLYEVARYYKAKGVVTIAGGQHFFCEENVRDALLKGGIDYVIIGEGEETIKELLEALEGLRSIAKVNGIAYVEMGTIMRTSPRMKLSTFEAMPLPDFSLVRYAKISLYPVERVRGCGMDCEFCTVKGAARAASAERLLEQIRLLVETRDARHFFIVDDLFGQRREETLHFCRILKEYQGQIGKKLDFTVQIRLDKAKDRELLLLMRQANINMVCIGFESPIAEELKAMNKHIRPEEMLSLAGVYRQYGFLVHGMFIFGYPMQEGAVFHMSAKERVKRYLTFIRKARLDTVQVLLPVPLPGTELSARLQQQGRIYSLKDVGWQYYDGNFPLFEPDAPLTAEEMQMAQRKIMVSFYRFGYFFKIGFDILLFPGLVFFLHNLGLGWRKWYRSWRNDLVRFAGWVIVRKWGFSFNKDRFMDKLQTAKERLKPIK